MPKSSKKYWEVNGAACIHTYGMHTEGENKGWKIKFTSIALEEPLNARPLFF